MQSCAFDLLQLNTNSDYFSLFLSTELGKTATIKNHTHPTNTALIAGPMMLPASASGGLNCFLALAFEAWPKFPNPPRDQNDRSQRIPLKSSNGVFSDTNGRKVGNRPIGSSLRLHQKSHTKKQKNLAGLPELLQIFFGARLDHASQVCAGTKGSTTSALTSERGSRP